MERDTSSKNNPERQGCLTRYFPFLVPKPGTKAKTLTYTELVDAVGAKKADKMVSALEQRATARRSLGQEVPDDLIAIRYTSPDIKRPDGTPADAIVVGRPDQEGDEIDTHQTVYIKWISREE